MVITLYPELAVPAKDGKVFGMLQGGLKGNS